MTATVAAVAATAPVRLGDVGGWTDTWFGAPGQVCHLAVGPGVRVEAHLIIGGGPGEAGTVRVWPRDLGDAYDVYPDPADGWAAPGPGRHPLLEHAVAEAIERGSIPAGHRVEVVIESSVPPGASLGTSAAVLVALLAALDELLGAPRSPAERAVAAHVVETARAGRQAGVQDQWAAAFGGTGLLTISPYPAVAHRVVDVAEATLAALGARLVTVVFGAHDSSRVHHEVINAIVGCGGAEHDRARSALRGLASLAPKAADALAAGDVEAWAQVLRSSTELQEMLHPALLGTSHRRAIEVAAGHGAAGWKVNGAGGAGGSLTVVAGTGPSDATPAALGDALLAVDPTWQLVSLAPAPGCSVSRLL